MKNHLSICAILLTALSSLSAYDAANDTISEHTPVDQENAIERNIVEEEDTPDEEPIVRTPYIGFNLGWTRNLLKTNILMQASATIYTRDKTLASSQIHYGLCAGLDFSKGTFMRAAEIVVQKDTLKKSDVFIPGAIAAEDRESNINIRSGGYIIGAHLHMGHKLCHRHSAYGIVGLAVRPFTHRFFHESNVDMPIKVTKRQSYKMGCRLGAGYRINLNEKFALRAEYHYTRFFHKAIRAHQYLAVMETDHHLAIKAKPHVHSLQLGVIFNII